MKWIAATLTSLIYVAGYLHGIHYSGHAAALGAFSVALLGLLFSRAQEGSTLPTITSVGHYPLELGSLTDQLGANNLMPLYVQRHGEPEVVLSAFICRLNNQRAIVLETN
jgi:hypothetical protein